MSLQSEILSLLKMLAPNDPEMGKVRVGSLGDGGYVLPDDLDQIDSVLSIGIGNEDSFDLHFAKKNIPIIFYFNGVHEDYHRKTDEVKKINFPLLAKRTQLVFYTAWELANMANRPVVDRKNNMPASR